jgi:hypothetical protein
MFPMNDKQTLTKTASFLGTSNCIVVKNEGKLLDCFKASQLAQEQLKEEYVEKIVIDPDLMPSYGLGLQDIKASLDNEVVKDILTSVGYEMIGNKFKLREENTPSCKVYSSGYMKDYGGDFSGDIFALLVEYHGMSFKDAMRYVSNFI